MGMSRYDVSSTYIDVSPRGENRYTATFIPTEGQLLVTFTQLAQTEVVDAVNRAMAGGDVVGAERTQLCPWENEREYKTLLQRITKGCGSRIARLIQNHLDAAAEEQ